MSSFLFALHAHFPTQQQLQVVDDRREEDQIWTNYLGKWEQPVDVPFFWGDADGSRNSWYLFGAWSIVLRFCRAKCAFDVRKTVSRYTNVYQPFTDLPHDQTNKSLARLHIEKVVWRNNLYKAVDQLQAHHSTVHLHHVSNVGSLKKAANGANPNVDGIVWGTTLRVAAIPKWALTDGSPDDLCIRR